MRTGIATIVMLCASAWVTGCASTTPVVEEVAQDGLRNTELDVLFATEFPVASETEAMAKAAKALRSGDVDKALFFYVRALQFNPGNADLIAHIGDIHLRRNNLVMAKRAYLKALRVDDDHPRSLEAMGMIHLAEGNDELALADLTRATAADDASWRAHNALGIYLDRRGEFPAAQAHYDSALAQNPGAGYVLNNRGYSKYLAGDYRGATADLLSAASEQGFERAWGTLGIVYASQGQYDDAVSAYLEIMTEANAYNNVGRIALDNGDLDEARYFLDEAIRRSPTYFPAAEKSLEMLDKLWRANHEIPATFQQR